MTGDGSLEVLLFDETNGPAVQKETWKIEPVTFKSLLRKDIIGWGYTVFLPWTTYQPEMTHLRLKLCYLPAKGAPIYFESPVTMDNLRTVTYCVADLLSEAGPELLIRKVTAVAPRSWSAMGGPGTVDYFPLTMALVVNQTVEIQEQIEDLLRALRRQQDKEAEEKAKKAKVADLKRKKVACLLKTFKALYCEGKYAEAESVARKALELDPNNALATTALHLAGKSRAERQHLRRPMSGVEAPRPIVLQRDKVREIERKLGMPVSASFREVPLKSAIEELRDANGINIVIDVVALQEGGVSLESPVTIKFANVALKSALNLILRQVHLTYVIKDEVVLITTPSCARGKLTTGVYPVADLVEDAEVSKLLCWNEIGHEPLMRMLTGTVSPREWAEMGGAGTIAYFARTKALVIHQTADIHEQVREVLASLRRHVADARAEAKHKAKPQPKTSSVPESEECEEGKQGAWAPALPPVDPQVVAALDEVLQENEAIGRPCGAAKGPGVVEIKVPCGMRPRMKGAQVFEIKVPCGMKARMMCAAGVCPCEALKRVLGDLDCGNATNGCVELGMGPDGVRCECKVPCCGFVLHMRYENGRWTTWASAVEATSSEDCESADE
jgi:hypothetical protein